MSVTAKLRCMAWSESYLSDLDKWIRLDCRGNTNGVNAQFDTETERLAFPHARVFM